MIKKADGFQSEKIFVLSAYLMDEIMNHPLTRALFITDIGYFPHALNHYRERTNGCDSHILIYCVAGEGTVTTGPHNTFRITERTLVVLPADTPHSYGADELNPWSIYWFHLKGEETRQFLQSLNLTDGPIKLSTSDAEKFVSLFHQCYDILSTKSYSMPHHVHVSQTVKYLLSLIGLIPGRKEDERKQLYIDQAIQFMQDKLEKSLTLEELVSHTQISKQHLNYLFKTSTGFSPIDYYHRMKMQRAGQLLDLTELSIKEICLSLGFKDPYYFSRMFKKLIGAPPTKYRSKLKG
jgi:AraC-like DNA-binding protein